MICPRCGAYSPYNTSACNRCGTKLTGSDAGRSPRRSRSKQYYSRTRKSDWERSRDEFLAKANDALDGIMADRRGRILLIATAAVVLAALAGAMLGCISCACGGCADGERPAVSVSDAAEENPADGMNGGDQLHSAPGGSEEPSGTDASGTDAGLQQ